MDSSAHGSGVGFIPGPVTEVRPDVVRRLRTLFEVHDEMEEALVHAYRACHMDEDQIEHLWRDHDALERLTVRMMAQASEAEVEAAHADG